MTLGQPGGGAVAQLRRLWQRHVILDHPPGQPLGRHTDGRFGTVSLKKNMIQHVLKLSAREHLAPPGASSTRLS